MTEFVALRAKAYAYIEKDCSEHKKAKGTKNCIIKRELMFENYRESLFNSKIILKSQRRFKSDHHKVYTEEVNKIALSSNDDERLQAYDKITIYPYGTNTFMVCENEMRYVLQRTDMLNNESKELRNESQVHRSESQILRDQSQKLRNEVQTLINKSLLVRNESQELRSESKELRNKSQTLRKWITST